MLFNTVGELKAVLPAVHQQNSKSLLGFAATAEGTYLVPALGEGLVQQLGTLPAQGAPAHLLALRERLRPALAYYTLLEAAPILAVTLNDAGATEFQAQGAAPSRQWVYNNFIEATAAQADRLLDATLAWLDQHAGDYADELDSAEYRSRQRLLIASADVLGRYVATGGSRRFFLALLPTLRQVEDFELTDLLGEELLEQLRDGLASGEAPSAEAGKLLGLVQPVLAHRALAQGLLSLSVALTGTALRLLSDNEAVRQRLALSPEALGPLSQQAAATADRYQARLATAPLGVKVVLHHFLAGQRYVHRAYRDLFKRVEAPATPPAPGVKGPPPSDGTELLQLLATLAERGLYGTYEQVAHTHLHVVLFNLAHEARHRRAAERETA